jgi:hypothetical protein
MSKQTAVEWLEQQLNEKRLKHRFPLMNSEPLFEQAKEMEKEQKIDFSKKCLDKALDTDIRTAHLKVGQYYDETYGGKNG